MLLWKGMTMDANSKIIEGRIVTVGVGSRVALESGRVEELMPCDWDQASFRYPNPIQEWREKHAIACNVQITGRTFQVKHGVISAVKVRIEWVGDDEPNTYTEGWLLTDVWSLPYAEEAA